MKKILYIIGVLLLFTSCAKYELTPNEQDMIKKSFNLTIEEPDYAPQSRVESPMVRYMLEMYEGDLSAMPVKMTSSTGKFDVKVKNGVNYVCLFWADNGTTYNVDDLKSVKQTDETVQGTMAYCANVTVNSNSFEGAIVLKRAVAELLFIEKDGLTKSNNTLQITYPYASAILNVGNGTVSYAAGSAIRTISNIAPPTQATNAFTTDFILAPTTAGELLELKLKLNSWTQKAVSTTVVQANFRTKIRGEYQPILPKAKVGDFYYDDQTYSTTLDNTKTCIGIVYVVDSDGVSGKVLGLTEASLKWGVTLLAAGANNMTDGREKMADIDNYINGSGGTKSWKDFPAFLWVATLNGKDAGGWNAVTDKWYVPAKDELVALYVAWNGDATSTVNDTARAAFNAKLTAAGSVGLSTDNYWSNTETSGRDVSCVRFLDGIESTSTKSNANKVRAIRTF